MKKLLLTFCMLAATLAATAADFMVTTSGGDVYYNIVDADALTCEYAPNPNGPYNLTFPSSSVLTTTVTNPNDGKTYTVIGVGENAFKDGTINSDASGGSVAYNHMWWWPNTITYIRAGAFENTKSNFPCARFNSGFTPGSIDKAAFINNRINQFNPAVSGNYYKVTDYNAGNTGDAEGRSGALYCEENGKKILLVYGGDHHRSSWERKPDGTSAASNPYYTLTTRVDLSEFNIIGENALYGNQNLQQITFGADLEAIETDAFKGATAITTIICNATTPPTGAVFEDVVYESIRESGNITVPSGSLDAYKADANWGLFWAAPAQRVHIAEAEHGAVAADNMNPEDGATVTLTVTPDAGYRLKDISVQAVIDPGNAQAPHRVEGPGVGIPVTLTTVTEGQTYTFEMPVAPYEVLVTSEFELVDYTVTVADGIENGTVEADKQTANYGEAVTLTVTPATGYELASLTYTVEGADPVTIENGTFNMPAADVTINA
ncbi:MAG: leucine-rich repeat protein, partial [Muribaculaceae bacterium]|nr:leucine-rich repeat protein [Muribaculaceae bacterium]